MLALATGEVNPLKLRLKTIPQLSSYTGVFFADTPGFYNSRGQK